MQPKLFLTIPLLLLSLIGFSQVNSNTLEDQFADVIEKSNNYQEYKVVKKVKLYNLRKSILDSVAALELKIHTSNGEIEQQKGEISTLTNNLASTQEELNTSKGKEDGIELLGMLTKKSTYNTIMWSIIGILLAGLIFLFMRYKRSHLITKDARARLAETETEFDAHRARTLEKEQQIRRKLQDEINKNRKVQ